MFIIFLGKLISLLFSYVIIKYFNYNETYVSLTSYERCFGWFFQEYISEKFSLTTGKFFMINKEFRNIILFNGVTVTKFIIFWSYIINMSEVVGITFMFISLNFILFTGIFDIYSNKKFFKFKDFFILLLLFKIYLQFLFLYSKTDLYIIYKLFELSYLLIILPLIMISYLILFFQLVISKSNFINYYFYYVKSYIKKNLSILVLINKFSVIIVSIIINSWLLNSIITYEIINSSNFFQELLINYFFFNLFLKIF